MIKPNEKIWINADWSAPNHIRAGTSLRLGGFSAPPYNELNLARHVGDTEEDVKKNRKTLANFLKLKKEPGWLEQTHSAKIISLEDNDYQSTADASCTTLKHLVCAVMTADCVPVLFCNKEGTKIAAIHAGWRGICTGIVENSINVFTRPETVLAWIGPCISNEYYEVGEDVYSGCLNHSMLLKPAFEKKDDTHWHADLGKMVRILLENAGIGSIYECKLCTYARNDLFFSYRRDGITGRTASMIWME